MEKQLGKVCEGILSLDQCLNLHPLASARSLIINTSSSADSAVISTLFETLTRSLHLPLPLHHTLKLLSDIAFHHNHLAPLLFHSLSSHLLLLFNSGRRLSVESLFLLSAITDRDPSLASAMEALDDRLFLSLCFGPSVSGRSWLLSNAFRLSIRPSVLLTMMLGFTKDPYPSVRKAALDGLVRLAKSSAVEDCGLVEGCYCRAVELLGDAEESVRCAAVQAVSEWGKMLVASIQKMNKRDCSDAVFLQLCSMVRDMSMEVRVAAFDALGTIVLVSEDILLQTLSKRVLSITKEKKSLGQSSAKRKSLDQCFVKHTDRQACVAAGAFLHGLEDEFSQVRWSACHSLHVLTPLSAKFAGEALNLLMDVLNDDSVNVRLRALETMHHMTTCDHLKLQETHMHMFLGTLVDNDTLIRSTARKILQPMKLHDSKMFKSIIVGLLENLKEHPEDEDNILSVLFEIGRNHGNFVIYLIKKFSQEIEPSHEGKLDFDSARVAALLVLAISVPLSKAQKVSSIPPRYFSYAVTLLGRISHALKDVMDQNSLLAYLTHCSKSTLVDNCESCAPLIEGDTPNSCINVIIPAGMALQQGGSENENQKRLEPQKLATGVLDCQLEVRREITKSIELIFLRIKDIWTLIQKGCMAEELRMMRNCKEEMATYMNESLVSLDTVAFTFQYLHSVELLAKVWEHFLPPRKIQSYAIGELNLLLEKLDSNLKEMRYRFRGWSKEEELHVLELILVTCILRLSKVEICCHQATSKKLLMIISHAEFLYKEGSIQPSSFILEVKKSLGQIDIHDGGASCSPFLFSKRLFESFALKQFRLSESLKLIKAEMNLTGEDTEPLPFVSGLPVGIPLEITLYNVTSTDRLWLRMFAHEELTEFVFLDDLPGGRDEVRKFTFVAPFHRTPKSKCFTLRVCIGMECLFEDVNTINYYGGPTRELVYICKEKEVHIDMIA